MVVSPIGLLLTWRPTYLAFAWLLACLFIVPFGIPMIAEGQRNELLAQKIEKMESKQAAQARLVPAEPYEQE